ncbi:Oligopeptide transporter 1 [Vitis vinifera]|uniref:Oligopeptide transporter 1 n=2 Tax=Vitis vinifera TaxID=29760 RepID=A0A438HRM7_VITVI|nr:Oligopeptide transporter 1 [Vitis vinifera]
MSNQFLISSQLFSNFLFAHNCSNLRHVSNRWAGIFRKFLVDSPYMWWSSNLVQVSLFRALHEVEIRPKGGVTRLQFFLDSITAQQIGSGLNGLGLGSFALDWSTAASFLGSPLATPGFAIINIMTGFFIVVYIVIPNIAYWTNLYEAKRFPIVSADVFDADGGSYNVSRVLNYTTFEFNQQGYDGYSKINLSIFFVFTYGSSFATLAATYLIRIWQQAKASLQDQFDDVHTRLMKKNYDPVPQWWFYTLLTLVIGLAMAACEGFNRQLQLPYWGILLAISLALLFILPVGVITATTNQQPGLNVITEMILGYIYPGKPLANLAFKTYGSVSMGQAIMFLSDFKLGHYMKIPPKSMFVVQLVGTVIASSVYFGTAWLLLTSIDNICHPSLLPEGSQWTCPGDRVFYSASLILGVVGPLRMFGRLGLYAKTNYFFLLGILAPVPVWLLFHIFPEKKWMKLIIGELCESLPYLGNNSGEGFVKDLITAPSGLLLMVNQTHLKGFINGKEKAPVFDSPEYEIWLSKDQLVMSWILNSMERNIAEIFSYSESSLDLWEALRDICSKKRTEEDRVFQVLASLGSEFEDLRCHILMSPELPSLKSVCSTIQREEVRRKVMIRETVTNSSDTRAYIAHKNYEGKSIKGKRLDLKCEHCNAPGHTSDRCWVLHPELKPKFTKDKRGGDHKRGFNHKANDFTTYLQEKRGHESLNEAAGQDQDKPTALLSKFAGFLADSNPENSQGIFTAFTTALEISNFHDLWVVDSVADGKDVPVQGKGKTKLVSKTIESEVLYVPSFPVQLLSVQQLTSTLNCDVLFTSDKVLFQDRITKKTIVEYWTFFVLLKFYSRRNQIYLISRAIDAYDTTAKRLFVSRDVQFVETSPIFENSNQGEILSDFVPLPEVAANIEQQSIAPTIQHPTEASVESTINQVVQESAPNIDISEQTTLPRRNPPRERHPPAKFRDYIAAAVRYPPEKFLSYQNLSTSHLAYLTAISSVHEPKNFHEANSQPMWRKSMDDELKALEETNTWNIVHLPPGKHVVGCRWVYRFKFNPDGSIERPKSRVVAQGFTQHFGVDYKETFAPVAKMSTVKVLLSVAANHGWSLSQMDVKNAFLHDELEEEVYMKIPPGHPLCGDPSRVCKLNKSIYGLKQSPRAWHAKLSSTLEDLGFTRSSADSSLYVQTGQTEKLMVLIYVDDLIITGSNADSIAALKKKLQGKFPVKDLGPLKYFLGIEVATSRKGLFLNQRKYTIDLLRDCNMLNSKPANTPFDSKLQLDKLGDPLDSPNYYQKLVGKLIYLTITRPDISFAVSLVSQHMHAPTVVHLCMVKRILRYLKKTIGRGIVMRRNGHTDIIGFSDSDWAGNTIDRRSTTGYCMFVGGNLVSWKSKKQPVVARSSAEAEYRAMAAASCEMVWLKNLLTDLGFSPTSPMKLFCDNQAAMHIAANPVFHERTKHIEVDCHFIRQQVQSKVIQTHYIRSSDQLADAFTKVLSSTVFHRLMFKLGSIDPLAPA